MKNSVRAILVIGVVIVGILIFPKKVKESDMLLQNVEALAADEGNIMCAGTGSVYCPVNGKNVHWVIL